MSVLPLRTRVKAAFVKAGLKWPAVPSKAIALGGAALQCKTMREAGLVCDVLSDDPARMTRNAQLLVFLLKAAGWDEGEADRWIADELRAAIKEARRTTVVKGRQTVLLVVDHPPRLITLKIEER